MALSSLLSTLLGKSVKNFALYEQAFTHTTFAHEKKVPHNERLEFLGDSVLGCYAADRLYAYYPEAEEGELTRCKAAMVEARACALYTQRLGLHEYLRVGKGEQELSDRGKLSREADLFEALLGALYLDLGIEPVYQFLDKKVWPMMLEVLASPKQVNWKAALQEYTQAKWGEAPVYRLEKEEGPQHAKVFTVSVWVHEEKLAIGTGTTKKQAEKEASEEAVAILRQRHGS